MKFILKTIIIGFSIPLFLSAQINTLDSLKVSYERSKDKRQQLALSLQLASKSSDLSDIHTYTQASYHLAKELKDTLALAQSYFYYGRALRKAGNNEDAISKLKKAATYAQSIPDSSLWISSWIEWSKALINNGHCEEAVPILHRAAQRSPSQPKLLRIIHNELGIAYNRQSKFDEALKYLHRLYDMSIESRDSNLMASALINMGVAYNRKANHPKALEVYTLASEILQKTNNLHGLSSSYTNLGKVYRQLGNSEQAMQYYRHALDIKTKIDDKEGSGKIYNNMANLLVDEQKQNEAIPLYLKALDLHHQTGNRRSIALTLTNIADTYYQLQQYDEGLNYGYEALEIFEDISDKGGLAYTIETIAKIYLQLNETPDAIMLDSYGKKSTKEIETMLLRAVSISEEFKDYDYILNIYYTLKEFYRDQRDFEKTLYYQDKYISTKDSIFDMEKLNAIAEMQTRFDTERRIQENNHLRQTNELINTRNKIFMVVAIVLLTLLISSILFYLKLKNAKTQVELQNKTIENQNERLTQLNKTKDRFFSIIAHDLKSPLISLQGLGKRIEFLLKRNDRQQLNEIGSQVDQTASKLNNLLDNLLSWASLQTGDIPYQPAPVSLHEIAEEVILLFENTIKINELHLINNIDPSTQVFADERALNTILRNLIGNAIKFTSNKGNITIDTFAKGKQIFVEVIDTGIGIPKQQMDKLFSADKKSTPGARGDKGTGLGLLLCKELIEVNKGSIQVFSKEGEGSRFVFSIPEAQNNLVTTKN